MHSRKVARVSAVLVLACASVFAVSACGPAVQPPAQNQAANLGKPMDVSTWNTILSGAEKGKQATMYKEEINASLVQGSLHSSYAVYGAVNFPNVMSLNIQEANTSTRYYQQGATAYYYDNGQWSKGSPLTDLSVYPSYEGIIRQAQLKGVQLYQVPKVYVLDEYCDVYQSVIPAGMSKALPIWSNVAPGDIGQMLMTWYVGKTDGVLREVDVQSVGGVPGFGSMQINATTVLFDIDKPIAQIKIPNDLVKQLEGSVN